MINREMTLIAAREGWGQLETCKPVQVSAGVRHESRLGGERLVNVSTHLEHGNEQLDDANRRRAPVMPGLAKALELTAGPELEQAPPRSESASFELIMVYTEPKASVRCRCAKHMCEESRGLQM